MSPRLHLRAFTALALLLWLFVSASSLVHAQPGGTSRYVYDNNGRLRAVIAPNGEAAIYDYDPAGNFTAIRRLVATEMEVIDFSPRTGPFGARVNIFGVGFGGVGSGGDVSSVLFNGTSATILSQTATSVVVEVPANATTGKITVTASRGTRLSADPFTVAGVGVVPASVNLQTGRAFQFNAFLAESISGDVRWSVNGIVGGNATVGTITASGLYTAPTTLGSRTIRATSAVESTAFGEATVNVISGNDVFAKGVSVRYGQVQNIARATPLSEGVLVRYGTPPNNISPYFSARGVSVQYGTPPNNPLAYIPSEGVLVRYGTAPNNLNAPVRAASVSVTAGPVVTAIAPLTITKGTTVTLTVTGQNLSGFTSLKILSASGLALETALTASGVSVNGTGTEITATLTATAAAASGKRVIVVTTPNGTTSASDLGVNTIQVVP